MPNGSPSPSVRPQMPPPPPVSQATSQGAKELKSSSTHLVWHLIFIVLIALGFGALYFKLDGDTAALKTALTAAQSNMTTMNSAMMKLDERMMKVESGMMEKEKMMESSAALEKIAKYNCEASGGTFKDKACDCSKVDAEVGGTYDAETGYCMTAFGIPGGEEGEIQKQLQKLKMFEEEKKTP